MQQALSHKIIQATILEDQAQRQTEVEVITTPVSEVATEVVEMGTTKETSTTTDHKNAYTVMKNIEMKSVSVM